MNQNPPDLPPSYKLVPSEEIEQRLRQAQEKLGEAGLDGLLILQNIDRYYFTGTLQDGILWLPDEGNPVFWVRRSLERARQESPIVALRPQPADSLKLETELRSVITPRSCIGFEMDVVPARLLARFQRLLPDSCQISDASPLIRNLRACKSPYEISRIKKAAEIMDQVMEHAASILTSNVSEIELMAELEHQARRLGHLGIIRMRGWNNELFFGHAISGSEAARRGYLDAPTNGLGLSPAFSQGASHNLIKDGVPISIDFMVNYEGYLADLTRMLCLNELPKVISRAHQDLLSLNHELVAVLRPGAECGEIFNQARARARDFGFADYFLGHGPDQVSFVGHGVGLEVDEFPFISHGNHMKLKAGMVVALEPKLTFPPGHHAPTPYDRIPASAVTTETTYLITEESTYPLTLSPEQIKIIKRED
ncbi:MAG: aminopeptidase P family protein [Deltaproteobacteria bacterium]|nr:aminopeptidase P family protein [Deltaproteobacteria bacterium]